MRSVEETLASLRAEVDAALDRLLPAPAGPAAEIAEAMRYAVLGGGKRIRPVLVLAACTASGGAVADAIAAAAAIEMIHTYSLVHDDLPAMDDDDLRRGRPTVHRKFGEAQAILAGDALLTLALETLAAEPPGDAHAARRAEAVAVAARAAGHAGMVGGQQADLAAERRRLDRHEIEWIHRHKTGALLSASAEIGAIHAGADASTRRALARFGEALGMAFQIADDILDVTATSSQLGKTPGKDDKAGKATYAALLGIDVSRQEAERWVRVALDELDGAGLPADGVLGELARFAASRTH